ncbi:MAG: hypothetical protein ACREM3_03955 [Candidatus Rokuibacteriota bacterium]
MGVIAAARRVASIPLARVVLGLVLLAGATGWAAERGSGDLYDTPTLQHWQARYTRSMNRILAEGFMPVLSAEERRILSGVRLDLPLRDAAFLNFYTEDRTIVLPAAALHWLSEIYTAYAWLVLENYQLEPIEEYVAMLKHKKPADFPGGAYPPPLRALGIPASVLDDSRVDGLSLRLFNSARLHPGPRAGSRALRASGKQPPERGGGGPVRARSDAADGHGPDGRGALLPGHCALVRRRAAEPSAECEAAAGDGHAAGGHGS